MHKRLKGKKMKKEFRAQRGTPASHSSGPFFEEPCHNQGKDPGPVHLLSLPRSFKRLGFLFCLAHQVRMTERIMELGEGGVMGCFIHQEENSDLTGRDD